MKIRNILFATFSHTYQLLLYVLDAPTYIFFVAWYHLFNTLVIEASRLCFQPIHYTSLQLIVPKYCPPTTVSYVESDEKNGRMMVSDETLPIENSSGTSLFQLQYAAQHCHEEEQYLRTTFLVACSE